MIGLIQVHIDTVIGNGLCHGKYIRTHGAYVIEIFEGQRTRLLYGCIESIEVWNVRLAAADQLAHVRRGVVVRANHKDIRLFYTVYFIEQCLNVLYDCPRHAD